MQGYQFKGSGLKDGFSFDGRSGSSGCVLNWFHLYGGPKSYGASEL